jgi:predicted nucleic acid-binding protein
MNEVCYFDSSVLLSVILREENSRQAEALWQNSKHKVSSLICEAECLISLRRTQKTYPQKFSVTWLTQREKEIQNFLEQMTLKPFDKSIIEIIHQHHALAN